jgi:hypothetical protein
VTTPRKEFTFMPDFYRRPYVRQFLAMDPEKSEDRPSARELEHLLAALLQLEDHENIERIQKYFIEMVELAAGQQL